MNRATETAAAAGNLKKFPKIFSDSGQRGCVEKMPRFADRCISVFANLIHPDSRGREESGGGTGGFGGPGTCNACTQSPPGPREIVLSGWMCTTLAERLDELVPSLLADPGVPAVPAEAGHISVRRQQFIGSRTGESMRCRVVASPGRLSFRHGRAPPSTDLSTRSPAISADLRQSRPRWFPTPPGGGLNFERMLGAGLVGGVCAGLGAAVGTLIERARR